MNGAYYSKVKQRVSIPAGQSVTVGLTQQNTGFDQVTLTAFPADPTVGYIATPTLNGAPVTADSVTVAAGTALAPMPPAVILVPGTFPPNAPSKGPLNAAAQPTGIIPGVQVTNNGSAPAVFEIQVVARVLGSAP